MGKRYGIDQRRFTMVAASLPALLCAALSPSAAYAQPAGNVQVRMTGVACAQPLISTSTAVGINSCDSLSRRATQVAYGMQNNCDFPIRCTTHVHSEGAYDASPGGVVVLSPNQQIGGRWAFMSSTACFPADRVPAVVAEMHCVDDSPLCGALIGSRERCRCPDGTARRTLTEGTRQYDRCLNDADLQAEQQRLQAAASPPRNTTVRTGSTPSPAPAPRPSPSMAGPAAPPRVPPIATSPPAPSQPFRPVTVSAPPGPSMEEVVEADRRRAQADIDRSLEQVRAATEAARLALARDELRRRAGGPNEATRRFSETSAGRPVSDDEVDAELAAAERELEGLSPTPEASTGEERPLEPWQRPQPDDFVIGAGEVTTEWYYDRRTAQSMAWGIVTNHATDDCRARHALLIRVQREACLIGSQRRDGGRDLSDRQLTQVRYTIGRCSAVCRPQRSP